MATRLQMHLAGVLALALLLGLVALLPAPAAHAATLYRFRLLNTNSCVQDVGGSTTKLATCANVSSQKWSLTGLPNSVYVPKSQSSLKCLGVTSAANGTPVVMLTCASPPPSTIQWYIQAFAPNRFLAHTMLNTGKCIQASGTALRLADCNTSTSSGQWFELIQTT